MMELLHIEGMRRQIGQALRAQFLERACQNLAAPRRFACKRIGLELVPARVGLNREREGETDGCIRDPKQQEADIRRGSGYVKRLEQAGITQDEREQEENDPDLRDSECELLEDVLLLEMADLVRDHCHNLVRRVLLDQRIEERDTLPLPEPGQERIGLGGALRSVNNEDIFEREALATRIGQHRPLELSVPERLKFVEERHDPGRCDELDTDKKRGRHTKAPQPGRVARPVENPQDSRQQRSPEHDEQQQALE